MYHKIIIAGNLGSDPTMKYTADGKPVTSFSVATSNYKDETVWFRVTVWGKQAESCSQYLRKGSRVLVEGRLKAAENGSPRVYQRDDGGWAASFEVNATEVRFMSARTEMATSDFTEELPLDDIPF